MSQLAESCSPDSRLRMRAKQRSERSRYLKASGILA
jgi:hypothetical protein